MTSARLAVAAVAILVPFVACGGGTAAVPQSASPTLSASSAPSTTPSASSAPSSAGTGPSLGADHIDALTHSGPAACGNGAKLRVHFYDVAQALAALIDLPDGRHILVDTGDESNRAGCGQPCATAHQHLMTKLGADLGSRPLDLLWITHQHSDHIGGAVDVMDHLTVKNYVDNGLHLDEHGKEIGEVTAAHDEARRKGVALSSVSPGHETMPIDSTAEVKLTAIAPSAWITTGAKSCDKDRNECSILLRIDYCASSILFTGDAEVEEEALLDPHGPATLLQAGHHGSNTSSGTAFLGKVRPKYVVISAGKKDEGENKGYCHPRSVAVASLTTALGGPGSRTVLSFNGDDGTKCDKKQPHADHWIEVPASDHLWATERDGDVVLTTTGDGTFLKE